MSGLRLLIAATVAVLVTVALGAGSRAPWQASEEQDAVLRFSWRAVAEATEACRPPTEDEIAALPQHMRPTEVCEGERVPYRLRVELDGEGVIDEVLRAAGAREDRPIYVFDELRLAPGAYRVRVEFGPEPRDAVTGDSLAAPEVFERRVDLRSRDAVLVTRDQARFVILSSSPQSSSG
jgi:hypothetical protein